MLTELTISALGVIDRSAVELGPGLIALTGETGAGKTMITTGLGLLLGSRTDAGLVRSGTDRALVEGRFTQLDPVLAQVAELGAETEDDELLVARQVTAQGRSRATVGGVQTTLAGLAEVTGALATIFGQSEQIRLGQPGRQRELLDRSVGAEHQSLVAEYHQRHRHRRAVVEHLRELRDQAQERAREADMLRFGLDEIAAVAPVAGEDLELADQAQKLSCLDQLRLLADRISAALSGDEFGDPDQPGAVGLIGEARKSLTQLVELDPAARGQLDRLAEIAVPLNDLAADLASYRSDLEDDPQALETVMSRQADLSRLTRKYGTTIDEVLGWAQQAAARVGELDTSEESITQLTSELAELDAELTSRAAVISAARQAGGERLTRSVQTELAALAMPHARLVVQLAELTQAEPGPWGAEEVSLLFSANPGSEPGPLAKVASGGELSRVRLALEVTLAQEQGGRTLVFDEVDAGVGGAVGLEIGRRLARLAVRNQVIVVTHLPQVAAFADRHLVVSKSDDGQVTTSGIAVVTGAEREQELARMMAGLDAVDSALAHARDLLAEAGQAAT